MIFLAVVYSALLTLMEIAVQKDVRNHDVRCAFMLSLYYMSLTVYQCFLGGV